MKEVVTIKRLILILGVIGVMLMGGCEKAPSNAKSSAERVLKELDEKKGAELSCISSLTVVISGNDMYGNTFSNMELSLEQNTEIIYSLEPFVMHTQGTAVQSVDGTEMSSEIDMYQLEENDHKVLYSRYDEQWIRFDDTGNLKEIVDTLLSLIADGQLDASLDEAFQDKNSDICTMSVEVAPEKLRVMTSAIQSFLGLTDAALANVNDGISVEFKINKEKWLLESVVVDLDNYGNSLIGASGNFEGSFSQCRWELKYTNYENIEPVTVPEDVRQQVIDFSTDGSETLIPEESDGGAIEESREPAKQNAQGEYEILDLIFSAVAYVKPPAGFLVLDSSENSITFENDLFADIVYQFVEGDSSESIINEYRTTMSYMEDDANYTDVKFSEVKSSACGNYDASYIELQYKLEDRLNVEYFICVPVEDHMFVCQIYGLEAADEALVQEILSSLSFSI